MWIENAFSATFTFADDGHVWVVNSQLDDFAAMTAPSLPFTVTAVELGP